MNISYIDENGTRRSISAIPTGGGKGFNHEEMRLYIRGNGYHFLSSIAQAALAEAMRLQEKIVKGVSPYSEDSDYFTECSARQTKLAQGILQLLEDYYSEED